MKTHLAQRVAFNFLGDDHFQIYCGLTLISIPRVDTVVFEPAFATCEECLSTRTHLRNKLGGSTTKGQVNRSGETVASEAPPQEQHAVTAEASAEAGAGTGDRADDLPAPMPERGARAIVLLKDLLRLKAIGDCAHPGDGWPSAWQAVRELFAEESPGTVKP